MKIKETKGEKLSREYSVVVPSADVKKAMDEKIAELSGKVKVDGFRAGKVPKAVIESRYKDSVKAEVLEALIKNAVEKMVSENKLELVMRPNVKNVKFEDSTDLSFDVEVQMLPEVPALDYAKIKVTKYGVEVSEDEINDAVKNLLKSHATLQKLDDKVAIKTGHVAHIDCTGKMDGKEFPEGKVDNYNLEIGSKTFIDGFEDGLIGAKAGQTKTLELKFPKDYGHKDFAGKPVTFDVNIKSVSEKALPEFNDEFAKKFGFDSVDALKEKIKQNLKDNYNAMSHNMVKKELFDTLDKMVDFDLPEAMLNKESEFLNSQKKDNKEADNKTLAKRRVKLGLLLADVAKKENLKVSNEDIQGEVIAQIKQMPSKQKEIIEYYKNNPAVLESLKGKVIEDKAIDFIITKISLKQENVAATKFADMYKNNL